MAPAGFCNAGVLIVKVCSNKEMCEEKKSKEGIIMPCDHNYDNS